MSRKAYGRKRDILWSVWSEARKQREEEAEARWKALNVQPGKCYALCAHQDVFDELVLVGQYSNAEGAFITKKIIKDRRRGLLRRGGYLGPLTLREYPYIVEFDPQRFYTLDKQLAMLNVQLNAYQGIVIQAIEQGQFT